MNIRGFGVIQLNRTGVLFIAFFLLVFILYTFSNKNDNLSKSSMIDLKLLLVASIKSAENGGAQVLSWKDKMSIASKGKTKEGVDDKVTSADFHSHCAMEATLRHFQSDLTLRSEEKVKCEDMNLDFSTDYADVEDKLRLVIGDVNVNRDDVIVWIDPLDATKEYTEKLYEYVTTMVCVAVKGKPVIGVIHKPFSKETYWAWNEQELKSDNLIVEQPENGKFPPEKLRFIISRSHSGKIKEKLEENFDRHGIDTEIVTAGGFPSNSLPPQPWVAFAPSLSSELLARSSRNSTAD